MHFDNIQIINEATYEDKLCISFVTVGFRLLECKHTLSHRVINFWNLRCDFKDFDSLKLDSVIFSYYGSICGV